MIPEEESDEEEDSPEQIPENPDEEVLMIEEIAKSCILDPKKVSQALEAPEEKPPKEDFLKRRFSQIIGENPEVMVQFQNYISQK